MAIKRSRLTIKQILIWVDAYHERSGHWPTHLSGPIMDSNGETWSKIHGALYHGTRGLKGDSSLAKLLEKYGRRRNPAARPRLTQKKILQWADIHYRRTGDWPTNNSGTVSSDHSETWHQIDAYLRRGLRGFQSGGSLARLLADKRGKQLLHEQPRLTIKQIMAWADAHHKRTGKWPDKTMIDVYDAPGETWQAINSALVLGLRGLKSGPTLAHRLVKHRNVNLRVYKKKLTMTQILNWADSHHKRTGQWPKATSGAVRGASKENWASINKSLTVGNRGLKGDTTLAKLLFRRRSVTTQPYQQRLTIKNIREWIRKHHHRSGDRPNTKSGVVHESKNENWRKIDNALRLGLRGLPGGSSLSKMVIKELGPRE